MIVPLLYSYMQKCKNYMTSGGQNKTTKFFLIISTWFLLFSNSYFLFKYYVTWLVFIIKSSYWKHFGALQIISRIIFIKLWRNSFNTITGSGGFRLQPRAATPRVGGQNFSNYKKKKFSFILYKKNFILISIEISFSMSSWILSFLFINFFTILFIVFHDIHVTAFEYI